jgi:N-acetylglucosamine-6-phosphate deacetylase
MGSLLYFKCILYHFEYLIIAVRNLLVLLQANHNANIYHTENYFKQKQNFMKYLPQFVCHKPNAMSEMKP